MAEFAPSEGVGIRARRAYNSADLFGITPPAGQPAVAYVADLGQFYFHLGGPTNAWQVLNPSIPQPISVTLNHTNIGLIVGGATFQLVATTRDQSNNILTGRTYTWASSATAVATVSAAGLVTAVAAGTSNITVNDSGVQATCTAVVTSTTSNEPVGMTVQVDTGAISLTSVQLQADHWTTNGYTWSNFSPLTPSSIGEWRGNLVQPDATTGGGTGAQLNYPTNLAGGNSPVRFGVGLPTGAAVGVLGIFYAKYIQQYSANWNQATPAGLKNWEPRTQQQCAISGPCQNHVISATFNVTNNTTKLQISGFLQGPFNQSANVLPTNPLIGIVTGGQPHKVEWVWTQDNPPGTGNGSILGWVDGVLTVNVSSLTMLAAGNQLGWPFWMCDPTYGGAPANVHPPALQSWKFDQLRVSTK